MTEVVETPVFDKAQYLKDAFIKQFASDPDIGRLPLPDSIRAKLGVYQSLDMIPIHKAVNKALFSGERYSEMVEIKPDPTATFPDLEKLAEERRKELMPEPEEKPAEPVEGETKSDE